MRTDPIFVLSAPRSGSTLLRVMLAGHPRLFSPPELNLLQFETISERESSLGFCRSGSCRNHGRCDQRHGLQRALMELHHLDDAASQQMLDALIEQNTPIPAVYNLLCVDAAPRRLVDKTPPYAARLETLEKAGRLFPEAHYIYLYRHPYAVIESLVRNEFEPTLGKAEAVWKIRNENILKFLATVDRRRQAHVPYELLAKDPERVLRELCNSLEIEFDQALLTPYEGSRMTDGIRPGILPPGDSNFQRYGGIDGTRAGAGLDLELPEPLSEETRRIAGILGYEIGIPASFAAMNR
ncbi:MAG: sulfotransferase family protein [Actinomycetota bacterium]